MNRYDFLFFFDVQDANPNGDPDAGNLPRIDPETNHGLVTDVCLKRKLRNYVLFTRKDESPYRIYVKEKAILTVQRDGAFKQEEKEPRQWMCSNFYDVRTFGAVMSASKNNCGQVRGPVQISFARSIDPIITSEHAITRMAVETEKEAENQGGDNRTMGRKFTVPYALYRAQGVINPFLADQTGFGGDDVELLFESLEHAFDLDASAARPAGSMNARKLIIFEHASALGKAPAHKLFDTVTVKRKDDVDIPRAFSDYEIQANKAEIPEGVTLIEKI